MTLVTGATGFVGAAVVERLSNAGPVRAAGRRRDERWGPTIESTVVGDLERAADWRRALEGVTAVVHLAARVHVMHETGSQALQAYRRINTDGTLSLARQSAAAGVQRFVFLSSIKVNGEQGTYTEADLPKPEDPYAVSKFEAEVGLKAIAAATGMRITVIRPPLVYGAGVRANFRALARAVARGIPLPFGAVRNRRSLVALPNLVDLIFVCLTDPRAANQVLLVSDGDDLSTPELVRRLARAIGRPARLIPVPVPILMAGATLFGQRAAARRLLGSLRVDISTTRRLLGWSPPVSVDAGLRQTVAGL